MSGAAQRISPIKNISAYFSVALLLFYFFYFYSRIDAGLLHQAQQPFFYGDANFIREFFSYPGGVLELLGQFLSQFFYLAWSGSLLLAIIFGLVALAGRRLLKTFHTHGNLFFLAWLPTVFFFANHHDYAFELVVTLGFLLTLFASALFLNFVPRKVVPRALTFFFSFAIFYIISGGPALLFALIILLHDLFLHRRLWMSIFYAMVAVTLPFLGFNFWFIVPLQSAYFLNLGDFLALDSWALYMSFLVYPLYIVVLGLSRSTSLFTSVSKIVSSDKTIARISCGAIILILLLIVSLTRFQKEQKALWSMNYHAGRGEWQQVLDVIQKGKLVDVYIGQFQLHRALYHTGQLCESMFAFPQPSKSDALFLHASVRHLFPLQYSDLFFDLGLINEAQHWAHEALSVTGDTPSNLRRLAEVNIIKGENEVAKKCLRQLQKNMWHKKWATDLLTALQNSNFTAFPYLMQKKQFMVRDDFIIIPMRPQDGLDNLLEANKANKMAFEYNMAMFMLDGRIGRLIAHLDGMHYFPYRKTPRHLEEAMLLYVANTGRRDFEPPQQGISSATIAAFRDYMAIAKKHSGSRSAKSELAGQHHDTFWFYASFIYKKDS